MQLVPRRDHVNDVNYYSPRLLLLYFVAVSPSLGTAVSALGRLLLFGVALVVLFSSRSKIKSLIPSHLKVLTTLILITTAYMGLSIFWSSAELSVALNAWTRHARLLSIVLLFILIHNETESNAVLKAFVLGQVFVVFSAWLMVLSVEVPWATSGAARETYAVFGSYLEQSVSQSILAAILWFQRDSIFGKNGRWLAIAVSAAALVLTLGFLRGRTGAVVGLALTTLAIVYELPRKYLWATLLVPVVVVLVGIGTSKTLRDRLYDVKTEISAYSQGSSIDTSSGQRLMYWEVSGEIATQRPIFGHGSGSWNSEYRKQQAGRAGVATLSSSDPHQLFLLWAVEGGLVGLTLLSAIFACIFYTARRFTTQNDRILTAALLGLVISSMFNSMIFGIGMGDYLCVLLGILLCQYTPPHDSQPI